MIKNRKTNVKKSIIKKGLTFLLALEMVLTFIPVTPIVLGATNAPATITSTTPGTLTINNGSYTLPNGTTVPGLIPADTVFKQTGNLVVNIQTTSPVTIQNLAVTGTLRIQGKNKLIADSTSDSNSCISAINSTSDLTIDGTNGASVVAKGYVNNPSITSYGIQSNTLILNGGASLVSTGYNYGVSANTTITINNGTLSGTAKNVNSNNAVGVNAGSDITVSAGSLNGSSTGSSFSNYNGVYAGGNVVVGVSGTLIGNGGTNGINVAGTITDNGGNITGNGDIIGIYSQGIISENNSGTLTGNSTINDSSGYGIKTQGDISLSGANMYGTAYMYGIYASGSIMSDYQSSVWGTATTRSSTIASVTGINGIRTNHASIIRETYTSPIPNIVINNSTPVSPQLSNVKYFSTYTWSKGVFGVDLLGLQGTTNFGPTTITGVRNATSSNPNAPVKLTGNDDKHIIDMEANVVPIISSLSITSGGNGTVQSTKNQVPLVSMPTTSMQGDSIHTEANPITGYTFQNWTANGIVLTDPTSSSQDFDMPTNAVTLVANFVPIKHNLNITVAGNSGGIVKTTVGGTAVTTPLDVNYNSGVVAEAIPNPGYKFVNWTNQAGINISSPTFTRQAFTMPNNDVSMVANFAPIDYNLSITADSNGTLTNTSPNGPTANIGQAVSTTAVPNTGYHFDHWAYVGITLNPSDITNPNLSFAMPAGNVSVIAKFLPNSTNLNIRKSGGGSGTISTTVNGLIIPASGSTVNYNDSLTLLASPDIGSRFTGWTTLNIPTLQAALNPSQAFILQPTDSNQDVTITGNFEKITSTLSLTSSGNGTVGGKNGGIDISNPSSSNGVYGDRIDVSVSPATGYRFNGWTVSGISIDTTSANTTPYFLMPGNSVTLVANFVLKDLNFKASSGPGGTIAAKINGVTTSVDPITTTHYGDNINLVAMPSTGYVFDNWTGSDILPSGITNTSLSGQTIIMPNQDITNIIANFKKIDYQLSVVANGHGHVSAKVNSNSVTLPATTHYNDTVLINTSPDPGYKFTGWSLNGITYDTSSINTDPTFSMPSNEVDIVANFAPIQSNLNVISGSNGNTTTNVNGNVVNTFPYTGSFADQVSISAIPATGYIFDGWTGDTSLLTDPSNPMQTFQFPATPVTLQSNFKAIDYNISALSGGHGSVVCNVNGLLANTANYGDHVDITATPAPGYKFLGWTTNGISGSFPNNSLSASMPATNISVLANFGPIAADYSVSSNGNGSVIKKVNQIVVAANPTTVNTDDQLEATAIPDNGYVFDKWTGNTEVLNNINSSDQDFLGTGSAISLVANFKHINSSVTVTAGAGGTIQGGNISATKDFGDQFQVTAVANSSYHFTNWTASGIVLSNPTDITQDITMPGNSIVLTANFALDASNLNVTAGLNGTVKVYQGNTTTPLDTSSAISATTPFSIEAFPNPGYVFRDWTATNYSGITTSTTNNIQGLIMPGGGNPVTFFGRFKPKTSTLAITNNTPNGNLSGTVDNIAIINLANSNADYLSQVTASANPDLGYTFDHWTDTNNNTGLSTTELNNKDISFTMPGTTGTTDVSLVANYKVNIYNINITTQTGGKVVEGLIPTGTNPPPTNGAYGSTVNITAVPDTGYTFVGWQGSGVTLIDPSNPTQSIVIPSNDITLTPIFARVEYGLTVTNDGFGDASFSGDSAPTVGKAYYNDLISINGAAEPGYTFDHWEVVSGTISLGNANDPNTTFSMPTSDVTVKAIFKPIDYTVNLIVRTNGNISSAGGNASDIPIGIVHIGDVVTANATANEGFQFIGWTITGSTISDLLNENPTFTIGASSVDLTANFENIIYPIDVTHDNQGNESILVNSNPSTSAIFGDAVKISAAPDLGYQFDHWEDLSSTPTYDNSTNPDLNFTMPSYGIKLIPHYKLIKYSIDVKVNTDGVPSNSGGIINGVPPSTLDYLSNFTLNAIPTSPGYTFQGWTSNEISIANPSSTTLSHSVPLNGATITANFITNTHNITALVANGEDTYGSVSLSLNGALENSTTIAKFNDSVKLTAIVNPGYEFVKWVDTSNPNPNDGSTNSTLNFNMPDNDITLTAQFKPIKSPVNTIIKTNGVLDSSGGSVSRTPSGDQDYLNTINIIATANPGYLFVNWTSSDANIQNGFNPSTSFIMPGAPANITANFIFKSYPLSVSSSGHGTNQIVVGSNNYNPGNASFKTPINIEAIADSGYHLDHWVDTSGTPVYNNSTISALAFTMPSYGVNLKSVFLPNNHGVNIIANGGGNVNATLNGNTLISPPTSGNYNDKIVLTTAPKPGYVFKYWSSNTITINDKYATSQTIVMPDNNIDMTANFAPILSKLSVKANSNGSIKKVTVDGGGNITTFPTSVSTDQIILAEAAANNGYHFSGWEATGITLSQEEKNNPNLSIKMPGGDVSLVATFAIDNNTNVPVSGNGNDSAKALPSTSVGGNNSNLPKTGNNPLLIFGVISILGAMLILRKSFK